MVGVGTFVTSGPTVTHTFDTIRDWTGGRNPLKVFEQGDIQGNGISESSGQNIHKLKLVIEFKTDDTYPASGQTALEKWNAFDDHVQDINNKQGVLTIRLENQEITFTGKVHRHTYKWPVSQPDIVIVTIAFTEETKGSITTDP